MSEWHFMANIKIIPILPIYIESGCTTAGCLYLYFSAWFHEQKLPQPVKMTLKAFEWTKSTILTVYFVVFVFLTFYTIIKFFGVVGIAM